MCVPQWNAPKWSKGPGAVRGDALEPEPPGVQAQCFTEPGNFARTYCGAICPKYPSLGGHGTSSTNHQKEKPNLLKRETNV